MTKREAERRTMMNDALRRAGIVDYDDREALRRISMTLHRWHEMECGDGDGCIERENDDGTGRPFWHNSNSGRRYPIADREKGAHKRLAAIIAKYPGLSSYIQGDPRGAPLYILRPGDIPEGQDAGGYYSRGICVY